MRLFLDWLKRPYPFLSKTVNKIVLSLLVGLICFLFLLVFRPFGLEVVEDISFIFGFGVISSIILVIHYFGIPPIFTSFFLEDQWTIWKQLLLFASIIFWTGVSIYFYNSTMGSEISPQYGMLKFILLAFAVGILPIMIMTFFIEKVETNRNNDLAKKMTVVKQTAVEKKVILVSENQNENELVFSSVNFLFAKACGNYSEIHILNDGVSNENLRRISLKAIEDTLEIHGENFIRCHKSYLVNKNHIEEVSGNARSLQLKLAHTDVDIPVSRSIPRSLFS